MRRRALHINAALLTFTAGFLTVGGVENLGEALPLALCVFVLTETLPGYRFRPPSGFDPHMLKVAAVTFVLWVPVLAFFLTLLFQQGSFGNCTPDYP